MDRARLLKHFDTLADTPDAVAKLRELILDFAVRGRLSERDPADELHPDWQKLPLCLDAFDDGEDLDRLPPFELPASWRWVRLSDLGNTRPRNAAADKIRSSFVPMPCVPIRFGEEVKQEERAWGEIKKGYTHIADGDVVMAKITPCFENRKSAVISGLVNGIGAATTELHVFRRSSAVVEPKYVLVYLKSRGWLERGEPRMTGSAGQKRVPHEYFAEFPFPLPPPAEQKRIVARVEELLALCDELEARQTAAREQRTRLVQSAFDHLTAATTPADFRRHAAFALQEFPHLTATPDSIPALRQAILSLAVQGKLGTQDPNDEPADQVLARMRAKYGEVEQTSPDGGPAIEPFSIPNNWCWASFPELGEFARGKSKHRPRNDPILYSGGKHPLVQTGDVARARQAITTHTGLYNEAGLAQSRLWPVGTLCITIAANIADSGILGIEACFPDSVVGFIPDGEFGGAKYFEIFMRTAKAHLQDFAPSTAQKNINLGILENVRIPLPPLAEQKRIVAKVASLMSWCDELEARLAAAQSAAAALLDSSLHVLLAS